MAAGPASKAGQAENRVKRPAAPSGGDPLILAGLVFETAANLKRAVVPRVERDHDLPQQSLEVLVRLVRTGAGRLRMSDLAAQTALTPSGLTRAVDRLCEAGLVDRQICAEDRRGAFASLTETGFARIEKAMACHRLALAQLLDEALEPAEQEQLVILLRRVRNRLNPSASPPAG
ncbi:MAG TPA: MarR family transcriptional regulator [Acidimicrobiales bacterium]|nr:MarR family transcriptional regulator [Acidimicrobiales bacterium]